MFHLVQPVWSAFFPLLLQQPQPPPQTGGQTPAAVVAAPAAAPVTDHATEAWGLATWIAVPLLKVRRYEPGGLPVTNRRCCSSCI